MKTDLMIVREEDRIAVAGILVKNGYTVTQIKRKRTPTGKTIREADRPTKRMKRLRCAAVPATRLCAVGRATCEYGLRVERQEVSHADDR